MKAFSIKGLQKMVDKADPDPRRTVYKYDDKGQLVKVKGDRIPKQRSTRKGRKR